MLKFNELRIDENKNLIVDASVLDITADPNETIGIDAIKIGFGTNEDTTDFYTEMSDYIRYFDNINYTHTYNYKFVFVVSVATDIHVGSIYKYNDYRFKVVDVEFDEENISIKNVTCIYNEDTAITLNTSGSLTKVVGIGSNTVNYTSYTSERVNTPHLRDFRLVLPLTSRSITDNFGPVANTLIYVYVQIDIPADVWAALDNCSIATYTEGYAYDRCLIVNKVFDYLKELDAPCTGISNLANYITQINGLQIAIESNRFVLANKYWTKFFANNQTIGTHSSNCNCCH